MHEHLTRYLTLPRQIYGVSALVDEFLRRMQPADIEELRATRKMYPDAFYLCSSFGRFDLLASQHFNAAAQTGISQEEAYSLLLRELKAAPPAPDLHQLATRLVFNKIAESDPQEPSQEEVYEDKGDEIAARQIEEWLYNMPSYEEFMITYFLEQEDTITGNNNSLRIFKERTPDAGFSDYCIEYGINPRMHLISAKLSDVAFKNDGRFFWGANFRGATFKNVHFDPETSFFDCALMEGANLEEAHGLTCECVARMYISNTTRLPRYLDRKQINSMHQDLGLPLPPPLTDFEKRFVPANTRIFDNAPRNVAA